MMVGDRNYLNPTVHIPPWTYTDDPTANFFSIGATTANANFNADDFSSYLPPDALKALQRYLPSNSNDVDFDLSGKDLDMPLDGYSCDHFRMFEFKVRKCSRGRSHDWTECPFAHPGEKARRRDPRKYHYSGNACPDFRKGNCRKGDACEFAHGVFECWLHPARYRTQPCKDGLNCRRRVCFFAHAPEQLRVLSPRAESFDGSPHRLAFEGATVKGLAFMSSPGTSSPLSESPPMSPITTNSLSRSLGSNSITEMMASFRQLHLNKVKSMPPCWGEQVGSPGFGSPRMSKIGPGFCSLPSTPTRPATATVIGIGQFDLWENGGCEEEPVMERVESGRDLRARMFEKLSKENPLDRGELGPSDAPNPDVDWVSDLIK